MSQRLETLGNTPRSPEISTLLSHNPALVDLTLFPDGLPSSPEDSGTRRLHLGTVLLLGATPEKTGEIQAHFAFPESPEQTEFPITVEDNICIIDVPRDLRKMGKYEMLFHPQGVLGSLRGHGRPFSMGAVVFVDHSNNEEGREVVVVFPENPNAPFTVPNEYVTFSPAQEGNDGEEG